MVVTQNDANRLALELLGQVAMANRTDDPALSAVIHETLGDIPQTFEGAMMVLAGVLGISGPMLCRLADAEGVELTDVLTTLAAIVGE